MRITIPTYFTLIRLMLIPLMVIFYFTLNLSDAHFYSALMFLIASITDFIDGFLARRLKQVSYFGRFLDPVADKLIVSTALVLLVYEYSRANTSVSTPDWLAISVTIASLVILAREIVVTSLREWMAELGQSSKVAVSYLGKVKTAAQMTAIVWLLWRPNRYSTTFWLGNHLLEYVMLAVFWLAVILTIASMIDYLKIGYQSLLNIEQKEAKAQNKVVVESKESSSKAESQEESNSKIENLK